MDRDSKKPPSPARYTVRLDVSGLTGAAWDRWCGAGSVDGVDFHGLQPDSFEHWTVTATSLRAARRTVKVAIGSLPVEVVSIEPERPPIRAAVAINFDPATHAVRGVRAEIMTAAVRRALEEIRALAAVELEAGADGAFAKPKGGRGRFADVQRAIAFLDTLLDGARGAL